MPDVAYFAGKVLAQPLPGGALWHCGHCDLRFRWPRLPDYDALYASAGTAAWSLTPLRKDHRLVHAIVASRSGARNVLDFGCYCGDFLASTPPQLQRYGVEVADAAARIAGERTGAQVVDRLDRFPSELRFDLIVSMDVIEHMPSPRALLAQLFARLSPGGVLVLTTGDGANPLWRLCGSRWWYCYSPEHIAFISARWLRHHARAEGAIVRSVRTFNYLNDAAAGASKRWGGWLRYLTRPEHHARKRARRLHEQGKDVGVPGIGLTRDHLLIEVERPA